MLHDDLDAFALAVARLLHDATETRVVVGDAVEVGYGIDAIKHGLPLGAACSAFPLFPNSGLARRRCAQFRDTSVRR